MKHESFNFEEGQCNYRFLFLLMFLASVTVFPGLLRAARFRRVCTRMNVQRSPAAGRDACFPALPRPACSLCDLLSRGVLTERLWDNGQVNGRPHGESPVVAGLRAVLIHRYCAARWKSVSCCEFSLGLDLLVLLNIPALERFPPNQSSKPLGRLRT